MSLDPFTPEPGYIVAVYYAYNGSGVALSYEAKVVAVGEVNVAVESRASEIHADYGRVDGLTGEVMVPLAGDYAIVPLTQVGLIGAPAPVASFGWQD